MRSGIRRIDNKERANEKPVNQSQFSCKILVDLLADLLTGAFFPFINSVGLIQC